MAGFARSPFATPTISEVNSANVSGVVLRGSALAGNR
jgi:hypothetical protein